MPAEISGRRQVFHNIPPISFLVVNSAALKIFQVPAQLYRPACSLLLRYIAAPAARKFGGALLHQPIPKEEYQPPQLLNSTASLWMIWLCTARMERVVTVSLRLIWIRPYPALTFRPPPPPVSRFIRPTSICLPISRRLWSDVAPSKHCLTQDQQKRKSRLCPPLPPGQVGREPRKPTRLDCMPTGG